MLFYNDRITKCAVTEKHKLFLNVAYFKKYVCILSELSCNWIFIFFLHTR